MFYSPSQLGQLITITVLLESDLMTERFEFEILVLSLNEVKTDD